MKTRLIKRVDGGMISDLPSVRSASTKLSWVLSVLTHLPCAVSCVYYQRLFIYRPLAWELGTTINHFNFNEIFVQAEILLFLQPPV
jgi:hypothetical protein